MKKERLIKDVMMVWLEEKKKYIKPSTYAYYRYEIEKYIIPRLGAITMSQYNERIIQEAVVYWQEQGGEYHTPINRSTVQNLVMLIKQFTKYAVKENYIEDKTIDIHYIPTSQNRKKKIYSLEEQYKMVEAIQSELSYKTLGILLCINSGLRIGELCALRWEDFDFEAGVIHISRTLQRVYDINQNPRTRIIVSSPKTITSIRDVPLSQRMINVIYSLNDRGREGFVLTNNETYMEPRTFRSFYMNFLKRNNIEPLNFHCLRHTFATRCIENGGDYKSVSEILGHTTVNTTLNMYVHPQIEEKRKCVELIEW